MGVRMNQRKYYPEKELFTGEWYPSYHDYKINRMDEFTDAFGDERLPNYTVESEDTFCCGVL